MFCFSTRHVEKVRLIIESPKCIFVNENGRIPIQCSLRFFPKGPIDNKPALFQVMARRPNQ